MNDPKTIAPNGDDRQAPPQPKPWELPSQEGLPTFWRPETVEATIKANQEFKEQQARENADPPEVKLAREQRKKIEAHAQWEEHTVEAEKERTKREEIKAGAVDKLPPQARPSDIVLDINTGTESTVKIKYVINPWLPRGQVIGFYGRGETVKTSFIATLAAQVSEEGGSVLWISSEEPNDWIKVRHTKAGGDVGTLAVFEALATKRDANGRATATIFNVYEHLDAAIQQAITTFDSMHQGTRPLRLVTLDAIVALTTWVKSESPNSDASVKKLMAYLLMLAQKYDVCIVVIGHANKGKHDHISDAVMGARAWVDSPRQSFLHARDQREEYAFVSYAAKASLTGTFAATFKSVPIHDLFVRPDGSNSVLCKVEVGETVWGPQKADELWDAATKKEQEDEMPTETQASRKQQKIQTVVDMVLALLNQGNVQVTRRAVEAAMDGPVNTRHWPLIDSALALVHRVTTIVGQHSLLTYVRMT